MRNVGAFLCSLAIVFSAASAVAGPTSPLVLTAGDQGTDWVVQGTAVVTSWSTGPYFEYPIAVGATVRTTSPSAGGAGGEYTLAGVATGNAFTNGLASGSMWDGASDGTYNYAINWTTGAVTRFALDWSSPQALFTPGAGGSRLAITYDASNVSLWIGGWSTGLIENYSLSGTLLSSFTVPVNSISCLALDPADGTLWFGSQNTQGTFYQYSRSGVALSTQAYPSLASQNTLGGEFAIGAAGEIAVPLLGPAGLLSLVAGLAAAGAFAARRA